MPVVKSMRSLLSRRNVHRGVRFVLAGGSLAFGVAGSVRAERMAVAMAHEEDRVRAMAARDLRSGIELLSGGPRLGPLIARLRYDLGDTVSLLRRKPVFAPIALAGVLLSIIAILTRD